MSISTHETTTRQWVKNHTKDEITVFIESQLTAKNAEIEKWRKENETMTELVDEMDAEIDMLRKALGTAGLTINTQSAEIERLKKQNAELRRDIGGFPHLADMRQCMMDVAKENDKLKARIEFLEKVAEQAVSLGEIDFEPEGNIHSDTLQTECSCEMPVANYPELAAWLKEKENG